MSGDINVVALVRGDEQYIFLFDDANRTETLRMLGRYAADPNLSFTWFDAAMMSQKIRATNSNVCPGPKHQRLRSGQTSERNLDL